MKLGLLVLLLVTLITADVISLQDIIEKSRQNINSDTFIQHVCEPDQFLNDDGKCQKIISNSQEQELINEVIPEDPCPGQQNCIGQNFKNQNQLKKFINEHGRQEIPQVLPSIQRNTVQFISQDVQASPQRAQAQSFIQSDTAAGRDFSGTNNQEENVDEADILKTDGTYIYTISNSVLSIIRAYPSNRIGILSTITLKEFQPSAIFIEGNYLAVFGTKYHSYSYYSVQQPSTVIKVYDVTNRARPNLIREYELEGRYFNGRKTDNGFVYLLTTSRLFNRPQPTPWFDFNGDQIHFDLNNLIYFPGEYRNPLFVSIFSFDLRNPLNRRRGYSCLISEGAQHIYMSENAIYLSYSDWNRSGSDSIIHKIFVKRTRIVPFATARVDGTINNQFSMDQYYSIFRVATTSQGRTTSNNVYCFNFYMRQIGHLGGIAPTERIFSARYVDRRLYLVTFRRIDPFFVIGFQNHRYPEILGELKITGFSRYLHPYDQNTIIGLGRQADTDGRQLGLKIALFDVSDVANPKQTASFELQQKYASSGAEWEHKAFLFSRSKNLMVIPGSLRNSQVQFNGAFVFYVDPSTIELKGILDHLINQSDQFYKRTVERSLFIQELLYTKSSCLLRVNRIYDLANRKDLEIPCNNSDPYIYYPTPIDPPIRPIPRPLPIVQPRPIRIPIIADIDVNV